MESQLRTMRDQAQLVSAPVELPEARLLLSAEVVDDALAQVNLVVRSVAHTVAIIGRGDLLDALEASAQRALQELQPVTPQGANASRPEREDERQAREHPPGLAQVHLLRAA